MPQADRNIGNRIKGHWMNPNLGNIVGTIKQLATIVSCSGACVVTAKIFGIQVPLAGSIMDWSAVTAATSLASRPQ